MKKIFLLSAILILIITLPCEAQYWIQHAGGVTIDEGIDIATDANGNSYSTGYFTGTATFGNTTLHAAGSKDIYIVKLSGNGTYRWAVRAGGGGTDMPTSIKADAQGNSYITGYFYGTAHFGTHTITSVGVQDVFIAKYDSAGTCLWAKRGGGTSSDIGNGITVDLSGNVIITGQFKDTATFGSFTLISMNGSIDVFTAKLDVNGTFLWAKKGSGPYVDRGLDVASDASGNVYVTGQFSDTIAFDAVHNNQMYNAIFLIKYNANGVEQWFRRAGGGGLDIPRGIVVDNIGNPIVAGDFQGTLTFFSAPNNTTLTATYFNRIFLVKYDALGNKLWSFVNSSDGSLTVKNLAIDGANNPYVVGNFGCRLNDYANVYGQGTFNSVGFNDIFVSKWNAIGGWQWSRQIGGRDNDNGAGIAIDTSQQVLIIGSFNQSIEFPIRVNHYLGYPNNSTLFSCYNSGYCGDNFYNNYARFNTFGNSDAFIAKAVDINRQPLDYYIRTDSSCNRNVKGVCINRFINYTQPCPDTVEFCASGELTAVPFTCDVIGPNFTYLWSTGATGSSISPVTVSGTYWVRQTSGDGCFITSDTIHVIVHPSPIIPTITDDRGFNNHATVTTPIIICPPGPVLLTGGGFDNNNQFHWSGGPLNDSILLVTTSGDHTFIIVDSFGCGSDNTVNVVLDSFLTHIIPGMRCLEDSDRNDTIFLCNGDQFNMIVFDSLTNPTAQVLCSSSIAYDPYNALNYDNPLIYWTVTPNTILYGNLTNSCLDFPHDGMHFYPSQSGWYAITATSVRATSCDTDTAVITRSIYVNLMPVPVATISGNHFICPGDSTMLIASGGITYSWDIPDNSTILNDSIWASLTGNYHLTVWNAAGCSNGTTIIINTNPQPNITMSPANGLICPNDSVQLLCSGIGTFTWQGPNGPIISSSNPIYVTESGTYFCILTDTNGCVLVSNDVEVIQYNTPYLQATPDIIFCPGDSVLLTVITNPGSIIQWNAPLSGNDFSQYVHVGDTYSCTISSCSIITNAIAVVVESNPLAHISIVGVPILCTDSSLVLYGNLGMATYYWLPDGSSYPTDTINQTGTYKLITMNPDGCIAKDSIVITTTNNAITSTFSATPLSGCNPLSVTFFNASYNANSYLWNFGDNNTSTSANPTHSYTDSGTYSVSLIAYNTNVCGTFVDTMIRSNYITVYPQAYASFIADTMIGCVPFTVNFSNNSTDATAYYWSFGDGSTSTVLNPIHTYINAGIFTDTLICFGANGCNDTAIIINYITVINPPIPISSFSANPVVACDSVTVHFINNSSNGTNFLWYFGDGTSDTTANPNHTYTSSGIYSVTLCTYSVTLCGTKVDTLIQTDFITINPSAHAAFVADTLIGCAPMSVNFINNSLHGIASHWDFGNTDTSSMTSPDYTFLTPGIYTVTLITFGAGGCNDTAILHSIEVRLLPHVISAFSADTFRGCIPLMIHFTNTSTEGIHFIWNFGDSTNSTSINPNHSYTDTGIFTVTLVAINDTSICGIIADTLTFADTIKVGDTATIHSEFWAFPIKGCTPLVVDITNKSVHGTESFWTMGNGDTSTNIFLQSAEYFRAGTYELTLITTKPNDRCYVPPDTMRIEITADSCQLTIPNIFSPNNDGYNDFFNLIVEGCTHYHLLILNRWGQKIFESFQHDFLWDGYTTAGIQAPDGTYYYILTAIDINDVPISNKGFLTLIR